MSKLKLLLVLLLRTVNGGFEEKVKELERKARPARVCEYESLNPICRMGMGMSVLFSTLCVLTGLIFLGILKGLLGLMFFPQVGMCGMNLLIDLPRPMERYQEPELAGIPVIYDVAGWPIHPKTGRRTVRPVSKSTEFCMNVIFFITYPVIIVVTLCSYLCYKSYDEEGTVHEIYDNVNTVVFAEYPHLHSKDGGGDKERCKGICARDVYKDEDSTEEHDTRYVMEQMGRSSEKLKEEEKGRR